MSSSQRIKQTSKILTQIRWRSHLLVFGHQSDSLGRRHFWLFLRILHEYGYKATEYKRLYRFSVFHWNQRRFINSENSRSAHGRVFTKETALNRLNTFFIFLHFCTQTPTVKKFIQSYFVHCTMIISCAVCLTVGQVLENSSSKSLLEQKN